MKKYLMILMVLMMVVMAGAAIAQNAPDPTPQTVTVTTTKLYDANPASAEFFNQHKLLVFSRTSRNGEQTDVVREGNFYAECFVDGNVIRVKRCGNVVYQVEVQEETSITIPTPVCTTGPTGPPGPPGPPGQSIQGPPGPPGECTSFAQLTQAPCPSQVVVRERILQPIYEVRNIWPSLSGNGGFAQQPVQCGGGNVAVVAGTPGILGGLIGIASGNLTARRAGDFIVTATANGGYATGGNATGGQGGDGGNGYGYGAAAAAASSSSSSTSAVPGAAAGTSGSGGSSAGAP